jgi:hypothetical protein
LSLHFFRFIIFQSTEGRFAITSIFSISSKFQSRVLFLKDKRNFFSLSVIRELI